jgi:hypothetical protein
MEICKTKVKHVQVPFRTSTGIQVGVDEGLLETLILLRELGVETLFSCQGEKPVGGYILARGSDMTKLLAKMYYLHKRGRYSNKVSWLAHRFAGGTREFEYGKFQKFVRKGDGVESVMTKKINKISFGGTYRNGYQIEQMYSAHYGWRVRIGWYKLDDIEHIEALLRETKTLLNREG